MDNLTVLCVDCHRKKHHPKGEKRPPVKRKGRRTTRSIRRRIMRKMRVEQWREKGLLESSEPDLSMFD